MATMTKDTLKARIKELWVKMCEYEGIDEDESFICFSNDNPYLTEYDSLMKKYQFVRKVDHIGTVGLLK